MTFERAGLDAWPGLVVDWDGQWVRRSARGLTKRANSVQCFDPVDDTDVSRRVDAAEAWFDRQGLPTVFRLNLLTGPRLAAELAQRGYAAIDHSHLYARALSTAQTPLVAARTEILSATSPQFIAAQQALKGYSDDETSIFAGILSAIRGPAAGIVLYDAAGAVLSSGLMAIADGIVLTGNVVTAVAARRQGHAATMMQAGLAWAASAGARWAALNVAADNAGAKRLYAGLGYEHVYDYLYRVKGEPA